MDTDGAPDAFPRPVAEIESYHAHIYYETAIMRDRAARLRTLIGERFSARIGRWRDTPVGPHPLPMFQVAFAPDVFALFVPWLMLNRDGLTVLVHPNTDNPQADHLVHALWLGMRLDLDGSGLPVSMRALGEAHDPIEPNTEPVFMP